MKYLLVVIISFSFLLASCGDDENTPTTPINTTPMMPLAVGNEWVYDYTMEILGSTVKLEYVTKIEQKKSIYYDSKKVNAFKFFVYYDGNVRDSLWMFESENMLRYFPRLDSMEVAVIAPNNLTLESAKTMENIIYDGIAGTIGTDTLEIMDKQQECIKIEASEKFEDYSSTTIAYYIPEIGLVKNIFDRFTMNGPEKITMVLKGYTLN